MRQMDGVNLRKVAVIGCGFVGSASAFSLMNRYVANGLLVLPCFDLALVFNVVELRCGATEHERVVLVIIAYGFTVFSCRIVGLTSGEEVGGRDICEWFGTGFNGFVEQCDNFFVGRLQLCLTLCGLKIWLASQLLGLGEGNEHVVGLLVLSFGIDDLCLLVPIDGLGIQLPSRLGLGKCLIESPCGVEGIGMVLLQ